MSWGVVQIAYNYGEVSLKSLLLKIWELSILLHYILCLLWYKICSKFLTIEQNWCSKKKYPMDRVDPRTPLLSVWRWRKLCECPSLRNVVNRADRSRQRWKLLHWYNSVLMRGDQRACPVEDCIYTAAVSLASIPATKYYHERLHAVIGTFNTCPGERA